LEPCMTAQAAGTPPSEKKLCGCSRLITQSSSNLAATKDQGRALKKMP
jgi:hypothetical protein